MSSAQPLTATRAGVGCPNVVRLVLSQQGGGVLAGGRTLSQHVFAENIVISKPRLVFYEQDRTSGVPERIMAKARALLKNGGRVKSDMYANMDIPEIIVEWANDLKIGYEDDVKLSNFIGASPEAIFRWENSGTRPGPLMLKQYREIVRDIKVRLEKSSVVNFWIVIRNAGSPT